jgi:hypothetical protein
MTTAPTKPSEALRAARELLTPEGAWIQGSWAVTADGYGVFPTDSDEAVCWCARGAIEQQLSNYCGSDPSKFLSRAIGVQGSGAIADWNDAPERTQAEVLDAFSRAILLAEAEGQ